MYRTVLTLVAALALGVASTPAEAQGYGRVGRGHWGEEQALRIQFGTFEPRGESQYWQEKALDFTGGPGDFDDSSFGISYLRFLGARLGLAVSTNIYAGETSQHYLDFVDERGGEIFHDTELEIASFNLGLLLHLTRRDATISPYVGGGAGFYFWNLREVGDFIDFDRDFEIFFGNFEDDGVVFGHYLQAGVEVPVARNWSFFLDARWDRADDELGSDLAGLGELDLSGRAYSLGASFSF